MLIQQPVNHTSRTRYSLHHGLPLRFYFGTHCRSLFIFSHYRNTGAFVSCTGHCHWGILEYRDSSPIPVCFVIKVDPCWRSAILGRIAIILRASKPRKRHRLGVAEWENVCVCKCGSRAKGGRMAHALAGPTPRRHKESCIRIRTQSGLPGVFRRHFVIQDYI